MPDFGEIYIELVVRVKSVSHQPAEPDVGIKESYSEVEEIEIFDSEGFQLKNDGLKASILERYVHELNEAAAEAHSDNMRDAIDAEGDYKYEMSREA